MIIGVSATRNGLTDKQKEACLSILHHINFKVGISEIHHGDCVGGDVDFAAIAHTMVNRPQIIAHPGIAMGEKENTLRANFPHNDTIHPTQTHFARNRTIVNASDVMFILPYSENKTGGGTWYTYDFAVKQKKTIIVIFPNGRIDVTEREYLEGLFRNRDLERPA